ncbi:MAG TPA: putative sugar O-methyltransferase [Victivallales bacterium]|nr:putative sugar O-methyltransferase [Victivallales bacterium]
MIISVKKIIKEIIPPIFIRISKTIFSSKISKIPFEKWWGKYSVEHQPDPVLINMINCFVKTKTFENSSIYWNWLNKKNIQQLNDNGFENFKQTIARNYFTWVGNMDSLYSKNLIHKNNHISYEFSLNEILRKHDNFTYDESITFNIITALLTNYVIKIGGEKYISQLEEPDDGNPPYLLYKEKRISQDLLNSIIEYISISKGCNTANLNRIIEVGAGSWRTSFCMMKLLSNVKYIIVDIPPALYVSQTYLANQFKNKSIFTFRPFSSFEKIKDEFLKSDIAFIMPDQLELLPSKLTDLFLAIDCMHEMKKEQIDIFFNQVDRLSKFFYFKCWNETEVPFDKVVHNKDNYPTKNNWIEIFKKNCEVPSTYFETFYKTE